MPFFGDMVGRGPGIVYPASPTTLTYTGANQSYIVPAGVTRIRVKVWGAGGAQSIGGNGGSGGYTSGEVAVTPGETITVKVGQGGPVGTGSDVVSGGGLSGIFRSTTPLAVAGGGGAGNYNNASGTGGPGGGTTGGTGGNSGAGGGTQSAGGLKAGAYGTDGSYLAGGVGGDPSWTARTSATAYPNGGKGTSDAATASGQGGGDGYYGGGGTSNNVGGGAGGGSGYTGGMVSGTTTAGSGTTPPNTGDSDYSAGIGVGASSNATAGGNGKVVIY